MPRPAIVLALVLLGAAAAAQSPASVRERKSQRISVADSPATPPEVHVAPGTATLLLFDADIDRNAVELEGRDSRVALVDVGNRSVILEPLVELPPPARLALAVRFLDGRAPARATFYLVSDAAKVDERVTVVRQALTAESCKVELDALRAACTAKDAELAALQALSGASSPGALFLAGVLDERGVQSGRIRRDFVEDGASSLRLQDATSLLASTWALVVLKVHNTGKESWTPAGAQLTSTTTGERVRVTGIRQAQQGIEPGRLGVVVIEAEVPSSTAGGTFRLEVRDGDNGRRLLIPDVMF